MGIMRPFSSSIYDAKTTSLGNVNPFYWKIKRSECCNGFLVVEINYPNCINYEGDKILVYDQGATLTDLIKQRCIDPHFSEDKHFLSPIARFVPTDRGWAMAIRCARSM